MSPGDDGSQSTWVFREEEEIPGGLDETATTASSKVIEDIDLEVLAEEVYALLRLELRLERERQGWHRI